jgi:hypothetical protein
LYILICCFFRVKNGAFMLFFMHIFFVRIFSLFSVLLFFSDLLPVVLKTFPKSLKFVFKYFNIPAMPLLRRYSNFLRQNSHEFLASQLLWFAKTTGIFSYRGTCVKSRTCCCLASLYWTTRSYQHVKYINMRIKN